MSRATALLFAQEGAKVALAARTTEKMTETAGRVRANGGDVLTYQTDLSDAAQVESLIDATVAEFGGIDCFIHAAGGYFSTEHDITTMDPAYWDGALQKQFAYAFQSCAKTRADFREAGWWMYYHNFCWRTSPPRCKRCLRCCKSGDGGNSQKSCQRIVR